VTDELRDLLRAELDAERPPPLGDLVGTALADGRRIRRTRRLAAIGGGTAVAGVMAVTIALGDPFGSAGAPAAVIGGPATALPAVSPPPKRSGPQATATPEAMLVLLQKLVPPGRTNGFAKTGQRELHVQMYLDRGKGPGMIRLSVSGTSRAAPAAGRPAVIVDGLPDNCIQSKIVRAEWPGGLTVQADLSTCLAWDGRRNKPSHLALTDDEAVAVVTDPRWGPTMDADLVKAGAKEFPRVAAFS
jgi:hypothetical protein